MNTIFTSLKKVNYKNKKQSVSVCNYPFLAHNTNLAYQKGWQSFTEFCNTRNLEALPAKKQTICDFLIFKSARFSTGTLDLYLSAINKVHAINRHPSFNSDLDVKNTLSFIRRSGDNAPRRVKALLNTDLQRILNKMPETLIAKRDAAILSIGFAAALRRSEICALKIDDIEFIEENNKSKILLNIRRSKTDQSGQGYKIAIMNGGKIQPIQKLLAWIQAGNIQQGHLFRSINKSGQVKVNPLHHSDIPRLVKYYVANIGLNPQEYAGHSLRSGFITSAAIHGARLDKIMEVSRHKNFNVVMGYIRDSNIFDNHAGKDFL